MADLHTNEHELPVNSSAEMDNADNQHVDEGPGAKAAFDAVKEGTSRKQGLEKNYIKVADKDNPYIDERRVEKAVLEAAQREEKARINRANAAQQAAYEKARKLAEYLKSGSSS